jgi:hypothetical protein
LRQGIPDRGVRKHFAPDRPSAFLIACKNKHFGFQLDQLLKIKLPIILDPDLGRHIEKSRGFHDRILESPPPRHEAFALEEHGFFRSGVFLF